MMHHMCVYEGYVRRNLLALHVLSLDSSWGGGATVLGQLPVIRQLRITVHFAPCCYLRRRFSPLISALLWLRLTLMSHIVNLNN